MGYYTSYSIYIEPDAGYEEDEEKFEQDLYELSGNDDEIKELFEYGVYAKLYDLSDWITSLASKYPHLLIMLSGDGEATDDLWEERWKGNDHERQDFIIPPFKNQVLLTKEEKTNKK